jgi:signal transduction histidine kinase
MIWTDLGWVGLGVGLGLGLSKRWRSRKVVSAALPLQSSLPTADQPTTQSATLQPLQLAYQLATEMSQFKGGFLARTSHELRSPLNGLIGMQQLILSDLCDSPEEEREFIAQANESALKMIKVLDTVLEVARLQHGTLKMEIQPLQLASLLQAIHDLTYLQAADRNLQLRMTLPHSELYVLADPLRLKQVLLYLIDTPIAQMQEGSIDVSVEVSVDTGYAHIVIDSDRTDSDRAFPSSEPIDLLQVPAVVSELPSPGLKWLTSQIMISMMQGTLMVSNISPAPIGGSGGERLRLRCAIPLVVPEPE